MDVLKVKLSCSGTPVDTTSWSETVDRLVPCKVAVTRIGVFTVPEATVVLTLPSAPLVDCAGLRLRPPAVVLSEKSTTWPLTGLPFLSSTLKVTMDDSCLPAPPVPFRAMFCGSAETKPIWPAAAVCTVRVPVWLKVVALKAVLAVITSGAPQPLSIYEVLATPLTVFTGLLMTALPALAHGELKTTDCTGAYTAAPFITVTLRPAVPPADRVAGTTPTPPMVRVGKTTV